MERLLLKIKKELSTYYVCICMQLNVYVYLSGFHCFSVGVTKASKETRLSVFWLLFSEVLHLYQQVSSHHSHGSVQNNLICSIS